MLTDLHCDVVTESGRYLTSIAHDLAYRAGWWTHLPSGTDLRELIRNPENEMQKLLANALVSQKLALVHSELADAVIRIADLAGALKLDLGAAIAQKLKFNANRPDHKPENRMAEGGKSY